ncbi:MAG: hypothetical protein AABY32_04185 [Nanoarchaeota archaeon]
MSKNEFIKNIIEQNRAAKKSRPTDNWFTIDSKINTENIHSFVDEYTLGPGNYDKLRNFEIIEMLEDMEAGLCTTNGDSNPVQYVTVRQLSILISAYLKLNESKEKELLEKFNE